jgi:hypothetical protein
VTMLYPFNRDEVWQFEKLTHRKSRADAARMKRNTNKFGTWLIHLLESTAPRPREDGEQFLTTKVYLHPEHNKYLHDHIGPWDYLCYSPVDDDTLPLDQIRIEEWFTKLVDHA